tara:strand:- start:484 stop:1041 length:558 start_codon:yes stop_codon:yes gene_type:complete
MGDTNKKMKELELKIYNSCMSWLEEEDEDKEPEIVEKGLWDHYSELPNPAWYEYKDVIEKKKYPDNVVYNNETGNFDSNIKSYPTTVGSQKFEPIVVDKSDSLKVNKHFQSKFEELKGEWDKLVEEYNWTSLVYGSRYSFQPTIGDTYHLYKEDDLFLSIIEPHQWDKEHMGSFKLLTNGKWDKV